MNNAPILVLQMQRMGDLVLSYPLIARLGRLFPQRPIWVVGEEGFFKPLMELSPTATYFSYEGAPLTPGLRFHLVLNLSHRPEAAALAGKAESDQLIGPYHDASGALHIRGDYQLYRASLTHNNRLNRFHWADLNCLDVIPTEVMQRTVWPKPRPVEAARIGQSAHIGLFLGASDPAKHPDAEFWTTLTRTLLAQGHRPVLLGGEAEVALGRQVATALDAEQLNLCGRFSVGELARFIGGLDLLITPDTGPMHVAVWSGTPVLNLSIGPVHAWETGPFAPGHHILRAGLECVGCWRCTRSRLDCRDIITPGKVARMAVDLLQNQLPQAERAAGCELLQTRRDDMGRYALQPIFGDDALRDALSGFWQSFFTEFFSTGEPGPVMAAFTHLGAGNPQAAEQFRADCLLFAAGTAKSFKKNSLTARENPDWWRSFPEDVRPLSGYIQMLVQNTTEHRSLRPLQALELLAASLA